MRREFALSLCACVLIGAIAASHAANLTLTANQTVLRPGDTLTLSASIVPTRDANTLADVYVALVLPSGGVLTLDPNLSWTAALVPIVSAFPLASVQAPGFYSQQWPTTLPGGGYTFYLVVVPAGANPSVASVWLGWASAPVITSNVAIAGMFDSAAATWDNCAWGP